MKIIELVSDVIRTSGAGWMMGGMVGLGILVGALIVFIVHWDKADFRAWLIVTAVYLMIYKVYMVLVGVHEIEPGVGDVTLVVTFGLFYVGMMLGAGLIWRVRRESVRERKEIQSEWQDAIDLVANGTIQTDDYEFRA